MINYLLLLLAVFQLPLLLYLTNVKLPTELWTHVAAHVAHAAAGGKTGVAGGAGTAGGASPLMASAGIKG